MFRTFPQFFLQCMESVFKAVSASVAAQLLPAGAAVHPQPRCAAQGVRHEELLLWVQLQCWGFGHPEPSLPPSCRWFGWRSQDVPLFGWRRGKRMRVWAWSERCVGSALPAGRPPGAQGLQRHRWFSPLHQTFPFRLDPSFSHTSRSALSSCC